MNRADWNFIVPRTVQYINLHICTVHVRCLQVYEYSRYSIWIMKLCENFHNIYAMWCHSALSSALSECTHMYMYSTCTLTLTCTVQYAIYVSCRVTAWRDWGRNMQCSASNSHSLTCFPLSITLLQLSLCSARRHTCTHFSRHIAFSWN